jgi:hypothetical protein
VCYALLCALVCVQELSLLQPWCPGVTATTAMQRTMSVYSSQFPTVRVAAAAEQQHEQPGVLGSVLSIMGASLAAMWDAVGEEGMRPFVVSCVVKLYLPTSIALCRACNCSETGNASVQLELSAGVVLQLLGAATYSRSTPVLVCGPQCTAAAAALPVMHLCRPVTGRPHPAGAPGSFDGNTAEQGHTTGQQYEAL